MKTLTILSFLTAVIAFAFSLINLEVACTLLAATGLLGIMNADYARRSRVLIPAVAPILDLPPANLRALETLELAA